MPRVHFANSNPIELSMSSSDVSNTSVVDKGGSSTTIGDGDVVQLRVTPDDVILFKKNGNEFTGTFEVTNITQTNITYKIKTTTPEKFRVRPSIGLLLPGKSATIQICLLKGLESTNFNKDKFLIMSLMINDNNISTTNNFNQLNELWKNTNTHGSHVEQHRLKCTMPYVSTAGGDSGALSDSYLSFNGYDKDTNNKIEIIQSQINELKGMACKTNRKVNRIYCVQWFVFILEIFTILFFIILIKEGIINLNLNQFFNNTPDDKKL